VSINPAFFGSSAAWAVWHAAPLTPPGMWAWRRQTGADPQQAVLWVPGHHHAAGGCRAVTGPRGRCDAARCRHHPL